MIFQISKSLGSFTHKQMHFLPSAIDSADNLSARSPRFIELYSINKQTATFPFIFTSSFPLVNFTRTHTQNSFVFNHARWASQHIIFHFRLTDARVPTVPPCFIVFVYFVVHGMMLTSENAMVESVTRSDHSSCSKRSKQPNLELSAARLLQQNGIVGD